MYLSVGIHLLLQKNKVTFDRYDNLSIIYVFKLSIASVYMVVYRLNYAYFWVTTLKKHSIHNNI